MITLILLAQAAATQPLNLTCIGGGTANKPKMATIWGGGESLSIQGRRHQGFADQVDVRLFSGDDRIRMPRTMLPAIRGGEDGWFRVKGLEADERSIRGTVKVNMLNNPKLHIDRVTGTISLSGKAGDYTGQCEAVAADAPAKF